MSPMRRDAYPLDWDAIALRVKDAASWICADCGMQCRREGLDEDGRFHRRERNHKARPSTTTVPTMAHTIQALFGVTLGRSEERAPPEPPPVMLMSPVVELPD